MKKVNIEQILAEQSICYNKDLSSHKGRINRLAFFYNEIKIAFLTLFIITIPFGVLYHLYNTKKRFFDITTNNRVSWVLTIFLFILQIICSYFQYQIEQGNDNYLFYFLGIGFICFITNINLLFKGGKLPITNTKIIQEGL